MKMGFPPAPAGFTLTEMRLGAAAVVATDGTQARRRRKDAFRSALNNWLEAGGRCDLLSLADLDHSPVKHLAPAIQSLALAPGPSASPGFPRLEPLQAPMNLPEAKHHPVILVQGLQAWFATLTEEYRRVFLRFLFEFDPDQQTPAPGLYTQALSTVRLIAVYDMSGVMERSRFVSMVTWRGAEDEPRTPSADKADCYLVAVVPSARARMGAQLGQNPWGPAVAAFLLANVGVWSPGRVELSVCQATVSATHLQGHLEESSQGMSVRDLIPLLSGFMRLGAATGDKLAMASGGLEAKTVQVPTLFDEKPRTRSLVLTYGIYAKVPASSGVAWSPFKTPALILMLGTYESVRLVSADFSISVPMGAANTGYAAITSTGTALKGDEWFGAAYLKMVPGSDQGSVVESYSLPATHSYNPELRAAVPGNGPPEFKFSLAGDAGTKMIITGRFQVEVAGQVVMGSIDISAAAKLRRAVRTVQDTLAYSVEDVEVLPPSADVVESDEESEDEAPVPRPVATSSRTSPPVRNRE